MHLPETAHKCWTYGGIDARVTGALYTIYAFTSPDLLCSLGRQAVCEEVRASNVEILLVLIDVSEELSERQLRTLQRELHSLLHFTLHILADLLQLQEQTCNISFPLGIIIAT